MYLRENVLTRRKREMMREDVCANKEFRACVCVPVHRCASVCVCQSLCLREQESVEREREVCAHVCACVHMRVHRQE